MKTYSVSFKCFGKHIELFEYELQQMLYFSISGIPFELRIKGEYNYNVGAFGRFDMIEFTIKIAGTSLFCSSKHRLISINHFVDRFILSSIMSNQAAEELVKNPIIHLN